MGLFSKESCCFCNKSVGILGRKKMQDKNYVCSDCEKNTSAFIDITKFNKENIQENIEYMKKQDALYKKEYETLSKEQKDRNVCVEQGIIFADSIGMFEVLSPRVKKRNYRELFRYDQVESYEKYEVPNPNASQGGRKFSETGVIIKLKCKSGFAALGKTDNELLGAHPFVSEFKIKLSHETDSGMEYKSVINHFDRIFLKEETYKSFAQTVKEDFVGTETQRRHMQQEFSDMKNLASFAKAKFTGDDSKLEDARENLKQSMFTSLHEAFGKCDPKYTKLADEAEKRAWNE